MRQRMPEAPRRTVICDTSALYHLHRIGALHLLRDLYGSVVTTSDVIRELDVGREEGEAVPDISQETWICVNDPKKSGVLDLGVDLGPGETSALGLALEHAGTSLVVLDDKLARRIAKFKGLTVTGTAGVLLKAKRLGVISALKPYLDALLATGFYLKPDTYAHIVALADETT